MFKAMLIKEFTLVLRDRHSLAALFILPLLFILIMSLALKDTFNQDRGLLHYSITDKSNSTASRQIQEFLRQNSMLSVQTEKEKPAIRITIPKNFSADIFNKEATEALIQIHAEPDVKQEMILLLQAELSADIMRLRLDKILNEIADYMPETAVMLEENELRPDRMIAVHYEGLQKNQRPNATQQSVPSWIVFGMFFVTIPMSTIFINERTQNTLMRMTSMNISTPALFAGKIAPYLVINQVQVWLMILCGMYIVPLLGGDPLTLGHSIIGLCMVSFALSLAAIGTASLIAVVATTVEQAGTVGGIINILFGAVGGVMVPKFYMPESMQQLTVVSPMSWGLEGFLDIFLRGYGARAVITETVALAGFGMVLLLLAGIIFNHKTRF